MHTHTHVHTHIHEWKNTKSLWAGAHRVALRVPSLVTLISLPSRAWLVALTSAWSLFTVFLFGCFVPALVRLGWAPWSRPLWHGVGSTDPRPRPALLDVREMQRKQRFIEMLQFNYLDGLLQNEGRRLPGSHRTIFRQLIIVTVCLVLTFIFLMFPLLGFSGKCNSSGFWALGRNCLPPPRQRVVTALDPKLTSERSQP